MGLLQDVIRALGFEAVEPPAIRAIRRFGEQLAQASTELRSTARRAVLLQQRADLLDGERMAWERRVSVARLSGDFDLMAAAAKMAGRVEGQLLAARTELDECLGEEIELRRELLRQRAHWLGLVESAERLGLDVSGCLLTIDLSRPEPPPDPSESDGEREFVARLIDRAEVN